MQDTDLTIILPSAGLGARLGANRPKELVDIHENLPIIRLSLQHILVAVEPGISSLKVVVVIRKGKEAVADYVRSALPSNVEVNAVYADPQLKEWPGSIHSAKEHFSSNNLALLPDSFVALSEPDWLRDNKQRTLIELAVSGLQRSPLVFGTLACQDRARLSRLGAVELDERGWVVAFQDKPREPASFNAFWGCFAFRREIADVLYRFLIASVEHADPDYPSQPFFPAQCFPLADYADLGTWESIKAFRGKYPAGVLGFTDLPGADSSTPQDD